MEFKMDIITATAENIEKVNERDWFVFLSVQKFLVEKHFAWLQLQIDIEKRALTGTGYLNCNGKNNRIILWYSPFYRYRYDRIFIDSNKLKYNDEIHLYGDMSLCLYHPVIDKPTSQIIPLFKMIPWIGEWLVYYEQWKKYGVWFGHEIKHRQ